MKWSLNFLQSPPARIIIRQDRYCVFKPTKKIQSESFSLLFLNENYGNCSFFQCMDLAHVLSTPNWTLINLSTSQNLLGLTEVGLGYLFLILRCYKCFWSNESSVSPLRYFGGPLYKSKFINCHSYILLWSMLLDVLNLWRAYEGIVKAKKQKARINMSSNLVL